MWTGSPICFSNRLGTVDLSASGAPFMEGCFKIRMWPRIFWRNKDDINCCLLWEPPFAPLWVQADTYMGWTCPSMFSVLNSTLNPVVTKARERLEQERKKLKQSKRVNQLFSCVFCGNIFYDFLVDLHETGRDLLFNCSTCKAMANYSRLL